MTLPNGKVVSSAEGDATCRWARRRSRAYSGFGYKKSENRRWVGVVRFVIRCLRKTDRSANDLKLSVSRISSLRLLPRLVDRPGVASPPVTGPYSMAEHCGTPYCVDEVVLGIAIEISSLWWGK